MVLPYLQPVGQAVMQGPRPRNEPEQAAGCVSASLTGADHVGTTSRPWREFGANRSWRL